MKGRGRNRIFFIQRGHHSEKDHDSGALLFHVSLMWTQFGFNREGERAGCAFLIFATDVKKTTATSCRSQGNTCINMALEIEMGKWCPANASPDPLFDFCFDGIVPPTGYFKEKKTFPQNDLLLNNNVQRLWYLDVHHSPPSCNDDYHDLTSIASCKLFRWKVLSIFCISYPEQ